MRKRVKRYKRIRNTILIIVLLIIVGTCILLIKPKSTNNNDVQKKEVTKLANKAWNTAYRNGKRDDEEIREFILQQLKDNNVEVDKYYFNISATGVEVNNKHIGLTVSAGYYKAGSNFTECISTWENLLNTRVVTVVDGRINACRGVEEKVDIVISNDINSINPNSFSQDLKVGSIIIPSNVTGISIDALKKTSASEIIIDSAIEELNGNFNGMESLQSIGFTSSVKKISGKTFQKTNIKEVYFVGSIEEFIDIKYQTYFDVPTHDKTSKLYINGAYVEEVVIPDGVEVIKDYALFNYENIKKITIPQSVKKIGTFALKGPIKKEIIYNGTMEMWNEITKMEEWHDKNGMICTVHCTNGNIEYMEVE